MEQELLTALHSRCKKYGVLTDVANHCGVSLATVTRVLQGKQFNESVVDYAIKRVSEVEANYIIRTGERVRKMNKTKSKSK